MVFLNKYSVKWVLLPPNLQPIEGGAIWSGGLFLIPLRKSALPAF